MKSASYTLLLTAALMTNSAGMAQSPASMSSSKTGAPVQNEQRAQLALIEADWKVSRDADRTLNSLTEFMARHPENISAKIMAARILEAKGYGGLAEELFKAADKLNPNQPQALLDEFRLKLNNEGAAAASVYLNYVLRKFPTDPDALRLAALLHQMHGNVAYAEFSYLQAIDNNPDVPGLRTGLANLRIHQKRYAEARKLLQEDFKLRPNSEATCLVMGKLYMEQARPAAAVPYLKKAYNFPGAADRTDLANILIKAQIAAGQYTDAMEVLCDALAEIPNQKGKEIKSMKRTMYALSQRMPTEEFVNIVRNAQITKKSAEQQAQLVLAAADVLDAGNHEQAKQMFMEGIRLMPMHASRPYLRLGDMCVRKRDYIVAHQMYRSAYDSDFNKITEAKLARLENKASNRQRDLAWRLKDTLRGGEGHFLAQ